MARYYKGKRIGANVCDYMPVSLGKLIKGGIQIGRAHV